MNVILKGEIKKILEGMVKAGFANTQSEAIRLAIFSFGKEHLENELAVKKMKKIHEEIKSGKRKVVSTKELAEKYPEFKELL